MVDLKKRKIKTIKVDLDKCNGCRACEIACAAFHAKPKYSSFNPARSRIRMIIDERNDEWVPIRATDYAKAECDGRRTYTINGKEYSECSFCGTICPSRDLFFDLDSGLPLKCDLCEDEEKPLCVQFCSRDALIYVETEIEVEDNIEERAKQGELETGLQALVDKYGVQQLAKTFARLTRKS